MWKTSKNVPLKQSIIKIHFFLSFTKRMSPENKISPKFSKIFMHTLTKNKELLTPSSNENQISLEHLSFTLIKNKREICS